MTDDNTELIRNAVLFSCSVVAVLVVQSCSIIARNSPRQTRTVTVLRFDDMLGSMSCRQWFEDNLRCSRSTFGQIAIFLRDHGVQFSSTPSKRHSYEKKIASALYFFASEGGYRETAAAMGMSKSYTMGIVKEVVRVLLTVAKRVISFPHDHEGWNAVEAAFSRRHGYPGVVGAIDGSLIALDRPNDFEGMYCRKGYPAFNVQAIVTADHRFMSAEIRPGAWSDRKCWMYSHIGRSVFNVIPPGTHFIGDAGYTLSSSLLVPYAEREEHGRLIKQQRQFNFKHSSTRMAVEGTFGIWKDRFRMLQGTMQAKTIAVAADMVTATMVLHNLFAACDDDTEIPLFVEDSQDDINSVSGSQDQVGDTSSRQIARAKRDAIAEVICH